MKTNIKEVKDQIRKCLSELNKVNNLEVMAREEILKEGFQMEADCLKNTVVFDPKNICATFNDPDFPSQAQVSNISNYIKILLAHEVGHLLDYKKNSFLFHNRGHEEQMELNAWEKGESLISEELKREYDLFKEFSLDSYRRSGLF